MAGYNQSVGPKEGKSAISAATRRRVFGGGGGQATSGYAPYGVESEGYGGQGDGYDENALMEMLRAMASRWRPQETFSEKAAGLQSAKDPVGWAIKQSGAQQQERIGRDPWGEGGAFEGRRAADLYSPETILASQGNTAENQLARLGLRKGIDSGRLADTNRMYANMWRRG